MARHTEREMEMIVRAFWRRIEPHKNNYGKELPKELPVEFRAHMATALLAPEILLMRSQKPVKSSVNCEECNDTGVSKRDGTCCIYCDA